MGNNGSRGPVIFLDVDGVLNGRATRSDGDHSPHPTLLDHVAHIVRSSGCRVVLSSTWRLEERSRSQVVTALGTRGVRLEDVDTPNMENTYSGDRVDEIFSWLETHSPECTRWVAIDDMDLVKMNERLQAAHFVRTDDGVGITAAGAEEVIAKLKLH